MRHIIRFDGQDHAAALAGPPGSRHVLLDDATISASLSAGAGSLVTLRMGNSETTLHIAGTDDQSWVWCNGEVYELSLLEPLEVYARYATAASGLDTFAPMPGIVVAVPVSVGDLVGAGDTLIIIESMKLEVSLKASQPGWVAAIGYAPGASFEKDAALVTLAALEAG